MPAVFLHSTFAYIMKRLNSKFSLPALLVGSMIPDVEVPLIYYLTDGAIDRLLFHSIIGAAIIGTIFSAGIVVFVYPRVISTLFKIDKNYIKKKCVFSGKLLGLCLIGNLSHVLIDATHHAFNPLIYPISTESVDMLRISGNMIFDTGIMGGILALIFFLFVIISFRSKTGFWKTMLVG